MKGRSGTQAVERTANEWAQAAPQLYRMPDPFGRLPARATGAACINASDVMPAADPAFSTIC